jgi:haloalkane dehalogenase
MRSLDPSLNALYPFRPHWATIGGLPLHYVDEGQGEPLLMLHGNPTWSFFFRDLIRGLAPGRRVIAPDHIGCGRSAKPSPSRYDYRLARRIADLTALLDALGRPAPLTLVLHDWGGMIGMAWAAAHPERVGRLVIFNTAAFRPPPGKRLPWQLRLLRGAPSLALPAIIGLNLFARGACRLCPAHPLPEAVRRGYLAPYDRPRHRWATLRFVQEIPFGPRDRNWALVTGVERRLPALAHLPVAIFWGLRDFVFDGDYLAQWRRFFPAAEVHPLPHAGHYLLDDAGARILQGVRAFLDRHPLAAAPARNAGERTP